MSHAAADPSYINDHQNKALAQHIERHDFSVTD
jgi:hypothetical protein